VGELIQLRQAVTEAQRSVLSDDAGNTGITTSVSPLRIGYCNPVGRALEPGIAGGARRSTQSATWSPSGWELLAGGASDLGGVQ